MNSVSHLWILDCPVHKRNTVHRRTISRIYATIITIMNAACQPDGVTPLSTASGETTDKKKK
jgi:hypothetical protein